MATSTVVPVKEYLRKSYGPDRDYVDGVIQERNLGERDHADLQSRFVFLLCLPENAAHVTARSELRVQVSATRFRVPDVCVLRKDAPREQIVTQAPLLCVEVLSPDDTMLRTRERVRDFLEMGVPEVWVVDPASRTVSICAGTTTVEQATGELKVPETPIVLALADIFKVLDEY
jgi:Uma2 family endonuclease